MSLTYQLTARVRGVHPDTSVFRYDPTALVILPSIEMDIPPTTGNLGTAFFRGRDETFLNIHGSFQYIDGRYVLTFSTMQNMEAPLEDLGPVRVGLRFAEGALQVLRCELSKSNLQTMAKILGDPLGEGALAFGSLTPRLVPATLELLTPTLWRVTYHTDYVPALADRVSQYVSGTALNLFGLSH